MLDVTYSSKFKKDFKTCIKRHCKVDLLQQAIDTLRVPENFQKKAKTTCFPEIFPHIANVT